MPNLILSTNNTPSISITDKQNQDHSKLINLGFDESGHRGFQKELTSEQLANIDAVQNKEDISNKIQSLSMATGDEAQYPSAKAVIKWVEDSELALMTAMEGINKQTIANKKDILSLQGQIGDVETAIDAIIAIQNSLIGGDSV